MLFAFEANLQRFAVEAMAVANRAGDPHIGQKIHFQAIRAVPFASLAAAAGDVEAEPARLVTAGFRFRQFREQIANIVGQFDVGGRIGARRAADRRLIDGDQFVEMLQPLDAIVNAGIADAAVEIAVQRFGQNVVHQRTFSRSADAGDANECAQRDFDGDIFQVVVPCADNPQFSPRLCRGVCGRPLRRFGTSPPGRAGG